MFFMEMLDWFRFYWDLKSPTRFWCAHV